MDILIDNEIKIYNLPIHMKGKLQERLTIKNPKYNKNKAMGLPVWNIPREIKLYTYEDNIFRIPRGFATELKNYIQDATYINNTLVLPKIDFESKIELRDYQAPASTAVKKFKQGVIVMPCGSGKTAVGLKIAAELGQPTLWLTHTYDLLYQAFNRAIDTSNLMEGGDIRVICCGGKKQKKYDIGNKITFGMVQTLANRDLSNIVNKFGCIIIDECHHLFKDHKALGQFYSVVSQFPAVYRIGLTASEHRSDGLIESMYVTIGPKIYEVTQEQLNQTGNVITPEVTFIHTQFEYEQTEERLQFQTMLKEMAHDQSRNILIYSTINKNISNDHYGLVLGDSLEHLEFLHNICKDKHKTAFIHGSTKKSEREKALQKMRNKEKNLLFATYQLAKEGLDIPPLDRLFLLTPKRDKVIIQQSAGRIMRPAPGKTECKIFDFYDVNVGACVSQAKERIKVYKSLGCKINGGPIVRNREKEMLSALNTAF